MTKQNEEIKVKNEYIQRLEGEPNSLFILKLNRPVPIIGLKNMRDQMAPLIDEFYPGSKVLILPDYVEAIRNINEQDLNELGWFKKPVD